MEKPAPKYASIRAVAEHCGVSYRTVSRWMDLGLPYCKPDPSQQGRVLIKWTDLDEWLTANTY